MVTDDERRKVAQILRSVDVDDILFDSELVDEIERACGSKRKRRNFRKIIDELVDIIDPGEAKECVTLSNDGVGEALPEALDAYDRDDLLNLADEMDHNADMAAGHAVYAARFDFAGYASRIREALGVKDA